MKRKKALTVKNVINKKRKVLPFTGPWADLIGQPEMTGTWLVWGGSGSGKTTFVMQLCKYMTQWHRVAYNSLEEGDSESIKLALIRTGMIDVGSRFLLLDMEPLEALKERLCARKAPRVVVIDSLQYSGLTYDQYRELRHEFRDVLFIFISHADGKHPAGRTAARVRYDSFVKIRVEGYRAYAVSRYQGESPPYTIWEEGAANYYGLNQTL